AVPLDRDLADLARGDTRVALLTEVDVGVIHAVEKPVESPDLRRHCLSQRRRDVGVTTAHGDVHGPLLAAGGRPSVRGVAAAAIPWTADAPASRSARAAAAMVAPEVTTSSTSKTSRPATL